MDNDGRLLRPLQRRRPCRIRNQRRGPGPLGPERASCWAGPSTNSWEARSKDALFCYATGHDIEWYKELGFRAAKLGLPATDTHDHRIIGETEDTIAAAREALGPDRELMLDCYAVTSDQDFIVRLAERLRPYRLKWIEDYLLPEDLQGYDSVRRRLPWQTLASGERWYMLAPFSAAAAGHLVDIMQPDIRYVGGMTACVKICHLAEAAGIQVMPHLAGGDSYGQHLAHGTSASTWAEFLVITAAGEPMNDGYRTNPGMTFPKDGMLDTLRTPRDSALSFH